MDLPPHGLLEEASAPLTRLLHELVPLSLQTGFRDYGMFAKICDALVTISAATLPMHAPSFLLLGSAQRSYRYGPSPQHNVHVIDLCEAHPPEDSDRANDSLSSDILVFVHGGAWGSGKPWMYRLAAAGLAKHALGARLIALVEYPVYPSASIPQQRDCVCAAVRFVKEHAQTWLQSQTWTGTGTGSGPRGTLPLGRVVLCGHSSGANISALALLLAAHEGYCLADAFIGLSGVYDVGKHFEYERSRGVHLISPMGGAAGFGRLGQGQAQIWECSPTSLLRQWALDCPKVSAFFPQTSLLLHGADDSTVPLTSTLEFARELQRAGVAVRTAFPRVGHVHPIVELMSPPGPSSPCLDAVSAFWQSKTPSSQPPVQLPLPSPSPSPSLRSRL
jgi:acetyl esterase/lipase